MDDKPTKRVGGAVVVMALVAVLVLLPVLYVLSIGPVAWMANSGSIDDSWMPVLAWAYRPLEWTAENVPVAGLAIGRYMELWLPPQPVYVALPAAVPSTSAVPTPAPAGPSGS